MREKIKANEERNRNLKTACLKGIQYRQHVHDSVGKHLADAKRHYLANRFKSCEQSLLAAQECSN